MTRYFIYKRGAFWFARLRRKEPDGVWRNYRAPLGASKNLAEIWAHVNSDIAERHKRILAQKLKLARAM